MKLHELLKVVNPEEDVTFEIIESTYPAGMFAGEVLQKYPEASEYNVISVFPATTYCEGNEDVHTLCIEVSKYKKEETTDEAL